MSNADIHGRRHSMTSGAELQNVLRGAVMYLDPFASTVIGMMLVIGVLFALAKKS